MCDLIRWRKLKNTKSFLYVFLIISVTFYISFHFSSSHNPKTDSQQIPTNYSNLYKLKFASIRNRQNSVLANKFSRIEN